MILAVKKKKLKTFKQKKKLEKMFKKNHKKKHKNDMNIISPLFDPNKRNT